jgi:hypothetical protein
MRTTIKAREVFASSPGLLFRLLHNIHQFAAAQICNLALQQIALPGQERELAFVLAALQLMVRADAAAGDLEVVLGAGRTRGNDRAVVARDLEVLAVAAAWRASWLAHDAVCNPAEQRHHDPMENSQGNQRPRDDQQHKQPERNFRGTTN